LIVLLVPHQYQVEASDSIFDYFGKKAGNPLVAMPTGTGKSVVIALFLETVFRYYPRQKILCLTHVKELIQQNYSKLMTLWPNAPAGVNSAGLKQRDVLNPIIFAGIGSVAKYAAQFGHVDLVLIDEAHLVSPTEETMYRTFLNDLRAMNPLLKVIGFTATPWRTGVGKLTEGGLFTDFCFDITHMEAFNRLIHEGYLCPLIPKKTDTVLDIDGVHIRGGEFVAQELQNAVDRDEVTERACREAMERAPDRQHWLAFCAGVEHAQHTADILNSLGVSAIAIHSKMGAEQRDAGIRDWKAGRFQCAVNNNVLTTGIDFPGIDLILMLRPTASTQLWVQMLGRGTRCVYAPGFNISVAEERMESIRLGGKVNCMVLDYAGNTRRLGPINDPVIPRKKGERAGDAPVKICDMCGTYNHASVRVCVGCGYEFPVITKLKQSASSEELIKGDMPQVEVFKIDHITYSVHTKLGARNSMRVSYYCGVRNFNEYVCVEHDGWAGRKARIWWRERSELPTPQSTDHALMAVDTLKVPTHLRVWVNKKYPEILAHCYDGSAFGTQDPSDSMEPPTTDVRTPSQSPAPSGENGTQDFDDDIPF
jgi:DNA repair protein RadD